MLGGFDGPLGLLPAFVGKPLATSAFFSPKPARALAVPGPLPPCSAFGSDTESRRSRRFHRGTGGTADAWVVHAWPSSPAALRQHGSSGWVPIKPSEGFSA